MPCSGPSPKEAYRRADIAIARFLDLLEHDYDIRRPTGAFSKTLAADHDKALIQLREAIRELFWVEACDSF